MPYLGEPYDADYYLGGREGFNARDAGYHDYPTKEPVLRGAVADDIEAQVGPVAGLAVLDVGCAYGFLADELALRGASVTGIDLSAFAIGEARSRFPSRTFVEGDATSTSFSNNTFDLAVICGVLECMPDDATMGNLLRELKRIAKGNGLFYALAFHDFSPPFQYNQRSQNDWKADSESGFPGKAVTVTDVGHLPVFYHYRIVVS